MLSSRDDRTFETLDDFTLLDLTTKLMIVLEVYLSLFNTTEELFFANIVA